jgi:hypothetical protein
MSDRADIPAVEAHIKTLRRWVAATKANDKARNRNAEILPRIGIRGGRATTNEARHICCAEEERRCSEQAMKEAAALHGFDTANATAHVRDRSEAEGT